MKGNKMNILAKYIYTSNECPKCEAMKKLYNEKGIAFTERSADRIKAPEDNIDLEALIQASIQNMELPVVVDFTL